VTWWLYLMFAVAAACFAGGVVLFVKAKGR
jgi:hypothetical protein